MKANRLLERWDLLALILTRPIPLLAETVVLMAGTSSMSWRTLLLSATVGALPTGLLYALVGVAWLEINRFQLSAAIFLVIAGSIWLLRQWQRRKK